jgi:hypothetical protein
MRRRFNSSRSIDGPASFWRKPVIQATLTRDKSVVAKIHCAVFLNAGPAVSPTLLVLLYRKNNSISGVTPVARPGIISFERR